MIRCLILNYLLKFTTCFILMLRFLLVRSATPPRACTHTIPLIPGATPFAIRPYRYAPALKYEIEQQVQEMLQAGLIQPSTSAFGQEEGQNLSFLCGL
jgi:hypothetical protein